MGVSYQFRPTLSSEGIPPKAIVGSLHPVSWAAIKECAGGVWEIIEAWEGQIEDAADKCACMSEILTSIQPRRGASTSVTLAIEMYG